jgi:hypothetical protein
VAEKFKNLANSACYKNFPELKIHIHEARDNRGFVASSGAAISSRTIAAHKGVALDLRPR